VTALDRANAFLKSRAVKLALTVIPLATIAVSTAQAVSFGLCTPDGVGGCAFSGSGFASGPGSQAGLTTSLTATPLGGGLGVSISGKITYTADAAGEYQVGFFAVGPTFGVSPLGTDTLPVSYDFTVDPGDGTFNSWAVFFTVDQPAGSPFFSAGALAPAPTGGDDPSDDAVRILGGGAILGLDPQAVATGWGMGLYIDPATGFIGVDWTAAEVGDTLTIEFPLDINAPEPTSVLLVGTGIGLLMLLRRRRQA
jgi:hypothetical protein